MIHERAAVVGLGAYFASRASAAPSTKKKSSNLKTFDRLKSDFSERVGGLGH